MAVGSKGLLTGLYVTYKHNNGWGMPCCTVLAALASTAARGHGAAARGTKKGKKHWHHTADFSRVGMMGNSGVFMWHSGLQSHPNQRPQPGGFCTGKSCWIWPRWEELSTFITSLRLPAMQFSTFFNTWTFRSPLYVTAAEHRKTCLSLPPFTQSSTIQCLRGCRDHRLEKQGFWPF